MPVLDELPELLTPPELARFMRTTTNCLSQDRYLGRGIPFIKTGRRILYARADVLSYLERNRLQRTDDPRGGDTPTSPRGGLPADRTPVLSSRASNAPPR